MKVAEGPNADGDAPDDPRILAVLVYDNLGERQRDSSTSSKWPQQGTGAVPPAVGDRVIVWLLRAASERRERFDCRGMTCGPDQRTDEGAARYQVHEMLGVVLELGCTLDQLDGASLVRDKLSKQLEAVRQRRETAEDMGAAEAQAQAPLPGRGIASCTPFPHR